MSVVLGLAQYLQRRFVSGMRHRNAEGNQLPHLATFAKAAELSSFTAAARALVLTQAAVSQRIQTLESALGVPLFRRQGGRVLLTEAGQRLYKYTQRILALHAEARAAITGQKTPVSGQLLLAASSVPGERLLPGVLPAFQKRYPHIQVRATVSDSRDVLMQVEHGKAHLGLVGMKTDEANFEFRSFACDTMVIVVPTTHSWARRRRVSLQELKQQPLIVREGGSGSRWCLERALAHAGASLRDLTVAIELGSNEAIKEAVRRGVGVSVVSTHAVTKEIRSRALHAVRVSDLPLQRDLFLVWDLRRVLPIPAQLFSQFLEPCPRGRPGP